MKFLISDTFTSSLARLTNTEQSAAKNTVFDLQVDPARPGLRFHRVDGSKDKNFWSVRVNSDIRIIVHRTSGSLLLCYVDHHDKAYAWAERRKLETHPRTGAAQIVEVRERVEEVVVPAYVAPVDTEEPASPPLSEHTVEDLLKYGVPAEWTDDLLAADEEQLLIIAERLPSEAAEAVLELAIGGRPRMPVVVQEDAFSHPDAKRRFRILENVEELERALEFPWEQWMVFLHPEQREWVEREFNGPARVSGSAGTGKTIVALHRAVHLARRHEDARVLLTTFTHTLANALRNRLRRLVGNEPRVFERIEVEALEGLAMRLHSRLIGPVELATDKDVSSAIAVAQSEAEQSFTPRYVRDEWDQVIDAWQIPSLPEYQEIARVGRRTRLSSGHRDTLWPLFNGIRENLSRYGKKTLSEVYTNLADVLDAGKHAPYDFAIIDEAQDLSVAQLRFFAALAGNRSNGLFFAGDLGQRIFQAPFSWKALGVDVVGRSKTLRVNYRTSHQIRLHADRLLNPEISDVDGHSESRNDTVSVFNGPRPEITVVASEAEESARLQEWLSKRISEGVSPDTIGVFVRSEAQLPRAIGPIEDNGLKYSLLDNKMAAPSGNVSLGVMHQAKGLEFSSVAVVACDDDVLPLSNRIEAIADEADLEEVYNTERHLLYVACT